MIYRKYVFSVKLSTLESKVQEVTLKENQMNENKKNEEIDKNMVVKLVDKYEKLKAVHIQLVLI